MQVTRIENLDRAIAARVSDAILADVVAFVKLPNREGYANPLGYVLWRRQGAEDEDIAFGTHQWHATYDGHIALGHGRYGQDKAVARPDFLRRVEGAL